MRPLSACVAVLAAAPLAAPLPAQAPGYTLQKSIPIGGTGGWDYLAVDTARNRLYVSHGTQVEVIDASRDTVIGVIANTPGVHGIALAYELGRGYVSSGRDSSVTIFDLRTLAVLQRVNVGGRNPDAIGYDPYSKRVFTFNGGSANSSVLDAASGALVGTLPLSGKPEFWVSDGKGHMFVNIEDKATLVEFEPGTLK